MNEEKIKQLEEEIKNLKEKQATKRGLILPISILAAGLMISFSLFLSRSNFELFKNKEANQKAAIVKDERVDVSEDDDPYLGKKNAKVTIIEFSDFQCPFCRRLWKDTVSQIKNDYINSGKSVKFVYRDFPLAFHQMAQKYAEAGECADDQGKFWEMHDKIFEEQEKLGQGTISLFTINDLKNWAKEIGLKEEEFTSCLDSNKYEEEVKKDFSDGTKAGVQGTPTLFINGRVVVGAQPYQTIKAIIEEELKK